MSLDRSVQSERVSHGNPGAAVARIVWGFFLALVVLMPRPSSAEPVAPEQRTERILKAARLKMETAFKTGESITNQVEASWQFARAAFDRAEVAATDRDRAKVAEEGIAACRRAIALMPGSAPAHYYLAMTLGQLAQTRTVTALKMVKEIEKEFKASIELDPAFDNAGAERSLGLLYTEAPGWPASVGNRHKARPHLERAVELAPDYPENHLVLLESYVRWNDTKGIERESKAIEELWPKAKKEFVGEEWESSWTDWEKRLKALKKSMR